MTLIVYNKPRFMSNTSFVSVIVTTKNEIKNIESCLKSISLQSYKNIEIIVIDNNSTDGTKEIARRYTPLVFNKGPERSAQRNFGAEKARGEFLLFLDADMILSPKVVEECVKIAQKSKIKVESPSMGGIVIPEKSIGKGYWTKCKALERSCYLGDSKLEAARFFKRNVFWEFKGYDEGITGPEDWDLPQRVGKKYQIKRINSFIFHNEGKISLFNLLKKKYYYGFKASTYLSKHPVSSTVGQIIYLLRPAFYRNWRKLYKNPALTAGMIIMLFMEQIAGFAGFIKGSFKK